MFRPLPGGAQVVSLAVAKPAQSCDNPDVRSPLRSLQPEHRFELRAWSLTAGRELEILVAD
jgi:hypothetical protein